MALYHMLILPHKVFRHPEGAEYQDGFAGLRSKFGAQFWLECEWSQNFQLSQSGFILASSRLTVLGFIKKAFYYKTWQQHMAQRIELLCIAGGTDIQHSQEVQEVLNTKGNHRG